MPLLQWHRPSSLTKQPKGRTAAAVALSSSLLPWPRLVIVHLNHHRLHNLIPVIFIASLSKNCLLLLNCCTTVSKQEKGFEVCWQPSMALGQKLHPFILILPSLDEVLNGFTLATSPLLEEEVLKGLVLQQHCNSLTSFTHCCYHQFDCCLRSLSIATSLWQIHQLCCTDFRLPMA